jgi:hypothetical protein
VQGGAGKETNIMIVHIPKAFLQPHKPPRPVLTASAAIKKCADIVSQHRFGVASDLLSLEEREIVLRHIEQIWAEWDARSVTGRAS